MTVESIFNQMINTKQIAKRIKEMLKAVDPQFAEEEKKFQIAVKKLTKVVGNLVPSAEEYLMALEERYAYELLYICWQGFQYNLDCFNSPVNALLLQSDFEMLHRERRLHTLSHTKEAQLKISAFHTVLREKDLLELTDGISDFYANLESGGYKLAHYFGFLFADRFLPLVIPGYTPDSVITNTYSMLLSRATGFNLFAIENESFNDFFRRAENE